MAGHVLRPQEGETRTFGGVNCGRQKLHCPSFYTGHKGINIKIIITPLNGT